MSANSRPDGNSLPIECVCPLKRLTTHLQFERFRRKQPSSANSARKRVQVFGIRNHRASRACKRRIEECFFLEAICYRAPSVAVELTRDESVNRVGAMGQVQ